MKGSPTAEDEYSKAIHQKCLQTDPTTPEHKEAWDAFYKSLEDQIAASEAAIKKGEEAKEISAAVPGNLNGNRDASWLFNGRLNPVVPYAIRGAIWNQGYANMGEGLPYYNNLHSLVRGWRIVWDKPELPVYFHQFYSPGNGAFDGTPSIDGTAEMRLGTWLARDIPHTGMASQIDIQGAIHYQAKAVPGQRLALHALKNQYGKKVVADGPMFKSYKVKGDKVIVEFDHAEGGLVVAETGTNATGKRRRTSTGFADPEDHRERRRPGEALLPGRRGPRLASGQHEDRRRQGHRHLSRRQASRAAFPTAPAGSAFPQPLQQGAAADDPVHLLRQQDGHQQDLAGREAEDRR